MPFIGDVLIDVIENEDFSESSKTTDHVLEDGEQITDHVESDPITISISGMILDPSDEKLLKLRKYRQDGELLTYNYRSRLDTVLITSFESNRRSAIKDGYAFSMSLKQVRLSKAPNVINVSSSVLRQLKSVSNAGRKQLA